MNGREFTILPLKHSVSVPDFPLDEQSSFERRLWGDLWEKPQAAMWDRLGLTVQVAAYVRALAESVLPEASAGLKTAVLRMEAELGISTSGMLQNGWTIETPAANGAASTSKPSGGEKKRQTPTGTWLSGVKVEGA